MKKTFKIFLATLVVLSLAGGFLIKNVFIRQSPLKNEMTIFSLENQITKIDTYSTEDEFDSDDFNSMISDEISSGKNAKCIIVAAPTGSTYFNNTILMQEVLVKKVIKGKCDLTKIWISNTGSSIKFNKNRDITLTGLDCGLMKKNNTYLIFCQPNQINTWSNKKIYDANDEMWFSYFNLDKSSTKLVHNNLYDKDIEFFTDSTKVSNFYNKLKQKIIKEFNK